MFNIVEVLFAFGALDDAFHRTAALPVPAFNQRINFRTQRHRRAQRPPQRQPQCVLHIGILWVGQQHIHTGGIGGHRHGMKLLHKLEAQRHLLGRQLGHIFGTAQRQRQLGRTSLGVVALGHQPQPPQQHQQIPPVLLLQLARTG